jgi:hypothetical protein
MDRRRRRLLSLSTGEVAPPSEDIVLFLANIHA